MARIRSIKPEFFTSEDIVALSPLARLLYIAIWLEADREGRLLWKPLTMKLRYFPADDCDITALCGELIARRLVVLYGDSLAHVPKFRDHQHINPRETPSRLPAPAGALAEPLERRPVGAADPLEQDASRRVSDACRRDSDDGCTHREEGKGKEGKGHASDASSVDPPSDPSGSPDPLKAMFDAGVSILVQGGRSESQARGFVGRLRKALGDEEAARALAASRTKTDPSAFLGACIRDGAVPRGAQIRLAGGFVP